MPTYNYEDKISGRVYEVVHKITDEPFKTVGDIFNYMGWTYAGPIKNLTNPVSRQISCEGGVTIRGSGVYKSGTISTIANAAATKTKAGVTKWTAEEIVKNFDEEDEDDGE